MDSQSSLERILPKGLLGEPAFGAFKRHHWATQEAAESDPKDAFDVLVLILGQAEPERVATHLGSLPLDADLLHEREITGGLMPTAEYRHGTLPRSRAVRDTVRAFFEGAYPGEATYDLGRIRPIPDSPRTQAAWERLRCKRGSGDPVGPLSAIRGGGFIVSDLDERKAAIGEALAEFLWEADLPSYNFGDR